MHQHAAQELSLEVSALHAKTHVVDCGGQASLNQAVQDVTNVLGTVIAVFAVASAERDHLLLPVLESLGLVEVLHAIEAASDKFTTVLLLA